MIKGKMKAGHIKNRTASENDQGAEGAETTSLNNIIISACDVIYEPEQIVE